MSTGALELGLVAAVVLAALAFVVRGVLRTLRDEGPGSGGCAACPQATALLADIQRAAREPRGLPRR